MPFNNNLHTFTNEERWITARNYMITNCNVFEDNKYISVIVNKQFEITYIYVFEINGKSLISADLSQFTDTDYIKYKTLGNHKNPTQYLTMSIIRTQILNQLTFRVYLSYKNDFYLDTDKIWKNISNNTPFVISKKIHTPKSNPRDKIIKTITKKKKIINTIHKNLSKLVYNGTKTAAKLNKRLKETEDSIKELEQSLLNYTDMQSQTMHSTT